MLAETRVERDVWLWDFDGYDHIRYGLSIEQVIDDPYKTMGHAFVLYALLQPTLARIAQGEYRVQGR